VPVQRLDTTYSTMRRSADGALVTKTRASTLDARRRFRNELRINQLLRIDGAPVKTPMLVAFDRRQRSLTFESVLGEPIGPKYPRQLSHEDLDGMIQLAQQLERYNPRRRWFRRLNSPRRLRLAQRAGLLSEEQAAALVSLSNRVHTRLRFAHGDLTARNVVSGPSGLTLIDWEWAGLYPQGYELAFLWFSLVDVPHGRARIERHAGGDEKSFLLSALLIQLWHLHWYVSESFRAAHLATRDALLGRLLD
jgi:hypothetical protein